MAELYQSSLLTHQQNLGKQMLQGLQVALPKIADRPEVRCVVGRQHSKSHILLAVFSQFGRRSNSCAVSVQQQSCHHSRMVGWIAPPFLFVDARDWTQIDRLNNITNKEHPV